MGNQILSQEEIDALLGAISKGEIDLDNKSNQEESENNSFIKKYDLTSKNVIFQNQFIALDELNDKFSKLLRDFFKNNLEQQIDINFDSKEIIIFESFLNKFSFPTFFISFTMEPLIGSVLLILESNLVFSMIDCLFGGNGDAIKIERDFSLIEKRIMNIISLGILESYKSAWKNLLDIKIELNKSESNPEYMHLYRPNDLVLIKTFSLSKNSFSGRLFICISHLMLEPIKEKLSSKYLNQNENNKAWTNEIIGLIENSNVNISAELGRKNYKIKDLVNLKIGDLIMMNSSPSDPIKVKVENVTKYLGYPGIIKGNRAIEISNKINTTEGKI